MLDYEARNIRNVVLLGHTGSGKTTLAENMLFESGAINRLGNIESGTTTSDYTDIEIEKKKSVFSSVMALDWRGYRINLIDAPGTLDYFGEVAGAMKVSATAVFVINAEYGVEVGTERHWNYAKRYNTPSLFVVNKVDHSNSDFDKSVEQLKSKFGREAVVVQYPLNQGEGFNSIVDVLKMTVYEFGPDGSKPTKKPIPDSEKEKADALHNELIEAIAENDESLMDLYFEKGSLDEDEMRKGLRTSMVNHDIFPIFCTCTAHNMGSGRLMGFIDNVAPSPLDTNGATTDDGENYNIKPDGEPLAFLFKSHNEEHVGDLTYLKVYSGTLKSGMDVINVETGQSSRLGNLFVTRGSKRFEVSELKAGDIGATVKMKDAHISDTIATKGGEKAILSKIQYPEPVNRVAIVCNVKGEEDKLGLALNQLIREDPSIKLEHSQELRQMILYTQGEEHLNTISYELKNRFGIDFSIIDAKIPYRETITKAVHSHYKHKKQSGGAGQYGEVYFYVEPWYEGMPDPPSEFNVRNVDEIELEWGGKLVFCNCIVGGVIDNRYMPAIMKGIMEKMKEGPLTGSLVRDVRVCVYDGSMHSVDSNDAAFKMAASNAFKNGFLEASPQLLEPIYHVELTLPSEYMGSVMGDLSTRRASILGMDSEGDMQVLKADVPLAEIQRYAVHLQSLTKGRASYQMTYKEFSKVPYEVQKQVVGAYQEEDELVAH